MISLPLLLTGIRLIIAPLVLPFLLVYLLPFSLLWINVLLGLLFVGFSLTDFFDGYLARKYEQVTELGALLDPIADKFLCVTTFIALLVVGKLAFYWVIIFIGRELFVMSLRLIAAEQGKRLSVSWLGKLKTAAQLLYATVAIVNPLYGGQAWLGWSEEIILCIALVTTLISAYAYYRSFITLVPGIMYPLLPDR